MECLMCNDTNQKNQGIIITLPPLTIRKKYHDTISIPWKHAYFCCVECYDQYITSDKYKNIKDNLNEEKSTNSCIACQNHDKLFQDDLMYIDTINNKPIFVCNNKCEIIYRLFKYNETQ